MSIYTRPIMEVDLKNVLENYKTLKSISDSSIAAAVVKDDAYGLGFVEVSKYLYENGNCKHFFVAHGIEGARIREFVGDSIIYVLQGMSRDNIDLFYKFNLTPVINSVEQFEYWKKNKVDNIKPILHVDTGLNRLGFRLEDIKKLSEAEKNEFSFVMSHLACADEVSHFMNQYQLDKFKEIKSYFPNKKFSLSASDGVFLSNGFAQDMVRLGAALYGINTAPYRENQMKPVVEVKAPIIQIEDLEIGQYAGYSATYRANSKRKIAIISFGYGDGFFRSLSNIGKIWFDDENGSYEARVIGRVSMDNIICDVTNIPDDVLNKSDFAKILSYNYTLDDMGRDAGTIAYEILSRIGKGKRILRKIKE